MLTFRNIVKTSFSTLKEQQQSQSAKTAVLMLNLGGPENLEQVTPFLENLFSDQTVIRIPFGLGKYIGKFRGPAKVQKQYKEIGGGSPIKKWTEIQGRLMIKNLQKSESQQFIEKYGPFTVSPSFRYSNPLFDKTVQNAIQDNPNLENLVLFSQYPQWSCTTGGNSIRQSLKIIKQLKFPLSKVKIIDRWYNNPSYINAIADIVYNDLVNNFSEEERKSLIVLFSAHSLPLDYVQQGDPYQMEIAQSAELVMQKFHKQMKQTQQQHTSNFPYRVVWQSKVGFQNWLKPNTNESLDFYSKTYKNVLLVPLGFTSDHLETLFELDLEYVKDNQQKYNKIFRARSLNEHPKFIEALSGLLKDCLQGTKELQSYPTPNFTIRCPECFCKNECSELDEYYANTQKQ